MASINYPIKKINNSSKPLRKVEKKSLNKDIHSKLGMRLEEDINITNKYYLNHDIAVIYKKPTPIKIVRVSYLKRSAAKITEAYFKDPSTTDYNGIYKGKYIDFEAKECNNATSFPFSSIHKHQIKHLENVIKHGAIAFIILKMVKHNEVYLIKAQDFIKYYSKHERKSLPYSWIKENGYLIDNSRYTRPCDYIEQINEAFSKEISL